MALSIYCESLIYGWLINTDTYIDSNRYFDLHNFNQSHFMRCSGDVKFHLQLNFIAINI